MATLTRTPEVTKTVVVKNAGVILELTDEEAEGLAILLRGGVGNSTLRALNIKELMMTLKTEKLGEPGPYSWREWKVTAQYRGRY